MQKRRLYFLLFLLAVVAVVGLLVTGVFREREPEYGGKRLSEWVLKLPENLAHPEPHQAEEAIRQIGTNALPYLLKWTRYQAPQGKTLFYRGMNSIFATLNSDWRFSDEKDDRKGGAAFAFRALGPQAEGAIPELTRMLNDPKDIDAAAAAGQVLGLLGNYGLPPLLAALTNQERAPMLRSFVVWEIGLLETNKEPCVRVL